MSKLKTIHRAAKLRASTFNPDDNTIDVVWSTGAPVCRADPWSGDDYDEVLSMLPGAVRLDRLNAGAPLLDTHDSSELSRIIGVVVKGSARIEGGKGLATVRLTTAKDSADVVTKVREGVVTNISVGYWVHASSETEANGTRTVTATDWEPLELSAVPVPADPSAQFRAAGGRRGGRVPRRVADIRRWARAAGLPKFGERHVRGGTSADAFFRLLTARLARNTKDSTMTKAVRNQRDHEAGAATAHRLLGKTKSRSIGALKDPRQVERDARERQVDDGIALLTGEREAQRLLGR